MTNNDKRISKVASLTPENFRIFRGYTGQGIVISQESFTCNKKNLDRYKCYPE